MRHLILAAVLITPAVAHSQGINAVAPLPGYACAMLNVSEAVMRDGPFPVVLSQPRNDAAPLMTAGGPAVASMKMIVAAPAETVGGFARVMHLDGQSGWIEAKNLRPFRSLSDPKATCTPAMMSDGKPGFR